MKRLTLKQQAYISIKDKILKCEYAPGSILSEDALSDDIQGSRTPIRDAISRLEQEHLVQILPKKGIIVSELSIGEITSMFETRLLIEPYALERYGFHIPSNSFAQYYQYFQNFRQNPSSFTAADEYQIDDKFHIEIVEATKNRYITQIYEQICSQNTRLRVLTGTLNTQRLTDTQDEHIKIVEHALKQDWEKAAQALKEHLLLSKDIAFQLLLQQRDFVI